MTEQGNNHKRNSSLTDTINVFKARAGFSPKSPKKELETRDDSATPNLARDPAHTSVKYQTIQSFRPEEVKELLAQHFQDIEDQQLVAATKGDGLRKFSKMKTSLKQHSRRSLSVITPPESLRKDSVQKMDEKKHAKCSNGESALETGKTQEHENQKEPSISLEDIAIAARAFGSPPELLLPEKDHSYTQTQNGGEQVPRGVQPEALYQPVKLKLAQMFEQNSTKGTDVDQKDALIIALREQIERDRQLYLEELNRVKCLKKSSNSKCCNFKRN